MQERRNYIAGALELRFSSTRWWRHQMETFPRYWPSVRGIRRSPVNSPHKGQWRGVLLYSFICAWTNCWANHRDAGHLRRCCAHYDIIDNIYSNQILDRDHSLSGIMLTDITDHYPIFHIANYVHSQNVEYSITRRNYTTRNKDNFISQLSNIDWADVSQSDSTQRTFSLLNDKLRNLHDNCFPLQHIS